MNMKHVNPYEIKIVSCAYSHPEELKLDWKKQQKNYSFLVVVCLFFVFFFKEGAHEEWSHCCSTAAQRVASFFCSNRFHSFSSELDYFFLPDGATHYTSPTNKWEVIGGKSFLRDSGRAGGLRVYAGRQLGVGGGGRGEGQHILKSRGRQKHDTVQILFTFYHFITPDT